MLQKSYQILSSKQLAVILFACICAASVPGTFAEEKGIYSTLIFRAMIGLLGINLTLCTVRRARVLPGPVVVMHAGIVLILAGAFVGSFGFVETVNIYEGTSVDKAYRWDVKKDVPLDMNLTVKKINTEFYPTPVRVGVLKGDEKVGLFELNTGGSFNLGEYRIRADSLEFPSENLMLSVFRGDRFIGPADTSGYSRTGADFPYRFVLVAFKNPRLKKLWVDLLLSRGSRVLAEGISEVNKPLRWGGISFYHTQTARDEYGMAYAGIQMVKDPGKPYVFSGFGITGLGAAMYLLKRLYGAKKRIGVL